MTQSMIICIITTVANLIKHQKNSNHYSARMKSPNFKRKTSGENCEMNFERNYKNFLFTPLSKETQKRNKTH